MGGEYFLFFSPVFNIADSAIFIGVATILVSQKRFFKEHADESGTVTTTVTETSITRSEEVIVTYSENGIEEQTFADDLTEIKQPASEKENNTNELKEGNSAIGL